MQRSCISALIYYAIFGVVYYLVIRQFTQFPLQVGLVLTGACAIFTGTFLAGLLAMFTSGQQRAAISRAERSEPLQDGRLEMVTGLAQPTAEPLVSPFQQVPCIAYTYKVSHTRTVRYDRNRDSQYHTPTSSTVVDYSGYALAPSVIQSPRGAVQLRGFLNLDLFPSTLNADQAKTNATAYVASTRFEDISLRSSLSAMSNMLGSTSPAWRQDLHIADGVLEPGRQIEESAVPAGQEVTGLGYYSASQGSFVSHWTWNFLDDRSIRLYKGDGRSDIKNIAGSRAFLLVIMLLGTVLTNLFLFAEIFATHR